MKSEHLSSPSKSLPLPKTQICPQKSSPTRRNCGMAILQGFTILICLIVSGILQAQIQFERVIPPPPAPQLIADFEGAALSSMAFADVDGDGDLDVLITGAGPTTYSAVLYINDGSGGYTMVNGTPFQGVIYSSIAFADVDGDGDQDVLITGALPFEQCTAKLYTNDGTGVFTLVSGTPFDGVQNGSMAFADVDGDGDQDVLITGENNSGVPTAKLYTNDGTGEFTIVNGTPFDGVALSSIAFADADGDGDQDVLITGSITGIISEINECIANLYTNDGFGGYTLASGTVLDGVQEGAIAFADVDGDGDQDVLITGSNISNQPMARLYMNDGNGDYTLLSGTPFDDIVDSSVYFADVDGDGDQDVLITGIVDGFGTAKLYTNDGFGGYTVVDGTPFYGVWDGSSAFADVDSDGNLDVVITGQGNGSPIATLYINDGNGFYYMVSGTPFDRVAAGTVAFADVDGDGDLDVMIGGINQTYEHIAKIYTNEGAEGFIVSEGSPFEGVFGGSIAFADVDVDGDQDVLITGYLQIGPPSAKLYTNDGTGNYTLVNGTPFEGVENSSCAFADVDGDGDQDVLIAGQTNSGQKITNLYANDGSGGYTLVSGTPFQGISSGSIAFADVDGDGDQDVLVAGVGFLMLTTNLYSNDGSGNFTLVNGTPFDISGRGSIAFADVDGDGDQDVLITGTNTSFDQIAKLYTNDGTGGFTLVNGTPFEGVDHSSVAFADVDGDGDQDVLISGLINDDFDRSTKLYINDGLGAFTHLSGLPFDAVGAGSLAFADIDGDGDPDVLITGSNQSNELSSRLYRNITQILCPLNASCSPFSLTLSSEGTATLYPEDIDNGSFVTCGTPFFSLSQTEFNTSHLGQNTVTLTISDEFGNENSCTSTVTVIGSHLSTFEPDINGLVLAFWPNPANDLAFAAFSTAKGGDTTIELFDLTGKRLSKIFHGPSAPAVEQRLPLNVGHLAPGIYMCRLTTTHGTILKKLVVSR